MDGVDAKSMRDAVDRAKDKLQNAIVVFASVDDGKVRLAAGVTKNNTDKIKAGDLIKPVAEQVGGKGGGRPDFAQAGGTTRRNSTRRSNRCLTGSQKLPERLHS